MRRGGLPNLRRCIPNAFFYFSSSTSTMTCSLLAMPLRSKVIRVALYPSRQLRSGESRARHYLFRV